MQGLRCVEKTGGYADTVKCADEFLGNVGRFPHAAADEFSVPSGGIVDCPGDRHEFFIQ